MINLTKIKSAAGASDYLSKTDDYYREGDLAPTAWHGKTAEELGLTGEVQSEDFNALLAGKLPDGTELTKGKTHMPGADLTLSAPKSVSALALAGGDARLIEAHDQAVQAVIAHIEQNAAATQIKANREVTIKATNNIAVATFRHASSRNLDPALHTHAVVLNLTKDGGQWRSLENRAMFRMQKELDTIYKNELARGCREAGYQIENTKDGFEIAGVDKELMKDWSSRAAQIDAELEKMGKTRETATAAEREIAALNTRKDKEPVDHDRLRETWRDQALERGIDLGQQVEQAKLNTSLETTPKAMDKAIEAVKMATDHLSERQSRFSEHELEKQSLRFAGDIGSCSKEEIRQAIELQRADGVLLDRQTYTHSTHTGQRGYIDGYTTAELVKEESEMLAYASAAQAGEVDGREVITRFKQSDIDLAKAALNGERHLSDHIIYPDSYIEKQFKEGKKVFDSSGRLYIQTTDGHTVCPELSKTVKSHESHNLNHLGLTKTKYVVTENGTVLKQGGTLKSEFAGWINDKANKKDAGIFTKTTAAFFKKEQNWRKAGMIESAVVRNIVEHKQNKTREAAKAALEQQSKGIKERHVLKAEPLCNQAQAEKAIRKAEKAAIASGNTLNQGQRGAIEGILTNKDRITLIQGYAGTAKTNAVLATTSAEFADRGYKVVAMAPTKEASSGLGDAIKSEYQTVAKHLHDLEKDGFTRFGNESTDYMVNDEKKVFSRPAGDTEAKWQLEKTPDQFVKDKLADMEKPQVWIVDEASLMSTKDMKRLLEQADKAQAKVILVGDTKQLGSVERGAAFRQLQEQSGLKTHTLDEIVRQKAGSEMSQAVYESIRGQMKESLDRVDKQGDLKELKTREERVDAIAKDYASQTKEGRADTIIITPGRDDKAAVDSAIREELKKDGTLHGETKTFDALEKKDLSKTEAKLATSFEPGEIVRDKEGTFGRVVEIDKASNRVKVEVNGVIKEVDPSKAKLDAFREIAKEIQAGDKIRLTAGVKDKAANLDLVNGTKLTVSKIEGSKVHCTDRSGKTVTLDMSKTGQRQVVHDYASTTFPAQGKTCARVLIHAESKRMNLQSQQNYYVAISRAKEKAIVYTDNKDKLAKQLESHTGQKESAIQGRDEPPQPRRETERDKREIKQLESHIIAEELKNGKSLPEAVQQGEMLSKEAKKQMDQGARSIREAVEKAKEKVAQEAKSKDQDKSRETIKKQIVAAKEQGKDIKPLVQQQVKSQEQVAEKKPQQQVEKQQPQQQQQIEERTQQMER